MVIQINTIRIKSKITQLTYRPKRSVLFGSESSKLLDDINKLLEDEVPVIRGKKRGMAKSDDDNDGDSGSEKGTEDGS